MDKVLKLPVLRFGKRRGKRGTTMNMTEGKPLALLSVFALPLLIGNLFQQAYNLADSMIVQSAAELFSPALFSLRLFPRYL